MQGRVINSPRAERSAWSGAAVRNSKGTERGSIRALVARSRTPAAPPGDPEHNSDDPTSGWLRHSKAASGPERIRGIIYDRNPHNPGQLTMIRSGTAPAGRRPRSWFFPRAEGGWASAADWLRATRGRKCVQRPQGPAPPSRLPLRSIEAKVAARATVQAPAELWVQRYALRSLSRSN